MNISALWIRRPVMTTLVMLSILLFGFFAYTQLPVSALPNVDFPTINVSASLPGASPETMAASVATPLEREFSNIDGLDSMTSSSNLGNTQITLQFDLRRDLDSAAQDVQAAISRASRRLPADMPTPPSYSKVNPAEQPILFIAVSSPTLPLYTVNEYAQTMLAQRISTVRGVAQVMVYGAQKYAVRVEVDPKAMAARGIGIDEVATAIRNSNVNMPTGALYGANKAFTIQSNGQLTAADDYRPLVVAYRDGKPVRLQDLGRVVDSVENNKTAAWYIDQRAVILAIQKQPGANTVDVSDGVLGMLPSIREEIPASVNLTVHYDRSESVRESVNDVQFTLLLTLGLVVVVIFLFLRNLRATIIPSLSMPLSIFGTFAVMRALNYTLDNLSLMALTLSVGFVVDDAIVMLENIVRHSEMGKDRMQAAFDGSKEVAFTIVSMTLSLSAVFLPILFLGGIVGRLFREFAVTIAVAILVSGFVSLTLTPMLSGRFLKPHADIHRGRAYRMTERMFEAMVAFYDRTLQFVLRHRVSTMVFSAGVLAATVYLFQAIPKGFLPTEDTGQLFMMTEAAEGISFEAMVQKQQEVAAVVAKHPGVQGLMSSAGGRGGSLGGNNGTLSVTLKPRHERASAMQIAEELRPQLANIPGIRTFVQVPPMIRIGGRMSKSEYQLTLQSTDIKQLYHHAPLLAEQLQNVPGLRDVTTDLQIKNPQLDVIIDRDRASSLGLSAQAVEDALYSAFGSLQISTIYAPTDTYQVIL